MTEQKSWTLEELKAMPCKRWKSLYMEDFATISKLLNLNWNEVKAANCQFYSKSYKRLPSKLKIASYLRSCLSKLI